MFGLVSPHLMAATVTVPAMNRAADSGVSLNVNSIVRPTQFSAIGSGVMTTLANQFVSQSLTRPQINSIARPDISLDRPVMGDVAISAVPLPAALWLFLPAVLGFFGLRQRSQTADKRIALAS